VGEIDGKYGPKTKAAVKAFQRKEGANKPSGHVGDWTKEKFKAYKYETGGLADFTGPAWLDGT
jgi:peptidoglycan hydrolase-like protein with peptidoglycan-binding domain